MIPLFHPTAHSFQVCTKQRKQETGNTKSMTLTRGAKLEKVTAAHNSPDELLGRHLVSLILGFY